MFALLWNAGPHKPKVLPPAPGSWAKDHGETALHLQQARACPRACAHTISAPVAVGQPSEHPFWRSQRLTDCVSTEWQRETHRRRLRSSSPFWQLRCESRAWHALFHRNLVCSSFAHDLTYGMCACVCAYAVCACLCMCMFVCVCLCVCVRARPGCLQPFPWQLSGTLREARIRNEGGI